MRLKPHRSTKHEIREEWGMEHGGTGEEEETPSAMVRLQLGKGSGILSLYLVSEL